MQANPGRDTRVEWSVRRIAHARGLRYRVNARPERDIRRTADMVFVSPRIAVFIDGCFWHGCGTHYRPSTLNVGYWGEKVANTQARDRETNQTLADRGWTVLRFWEHESPTAVVDAIERAVRGTSAANRPSTAAHPDKLQEEGERQPSPIELPVAPTA